MSIENLTQRSPRISSKGSMIVHTGTATAELPVGSNSTYLIANSSASVGINWATTTAFASPVMEIISSNTLTASATSVRFSNIPSTYEGLILTISHAKTSTAYTSREINFSFNSSSTGYFYIVTGNTSSGTTTVYRSRSASSLEASFVIGGANYTSVISNGSPGGIEIQIPGYKTNKNKSCQWVANAAQYISHGTGGWQNTAAISDIYITFNEMQSGAKFTLYGTSV